MGNGKVAIPKRQMEPARVDREVNEEAGVKDEDA